MRRLIRPLLLLACSVVASPVLADGGHQHPARSARRAENRPSSASREASKDRGCPIEQPKLRRAIRTYRVSRGDSLSGIAQRFGTSSRALAAANALGEGEKVRAKQLLVIPQLRRAGGGDDWLKYARPPKQRGKLDLYTYTSRFRGPVIAEDRVLPGARRAISALLGVKGSRPPLSERLLRLLVRVSDTFGGRPVRIVSGFRSSSYYSDSRHRRSEAVDFSIPGVPNSVLRQYLLLLADVGVGYYPNSSFVHLDVRSCPMQWTDYAGPGEPPRRSPRRSPRRPRTAQLDASPGSETSVALAGSDPSSRPAIVTLASSTRESPAEHEENHDPRHRDVEPDR